MEDNLNFFKTFILKYHLNFCCKWKTTFLFLVKWKVTKGIARLAWPELSTTQPNLFSNNIYVATPDGIADYCHITPRKTQLLRNKRMLQKKIQLEKRRRNILFVYFMFQSILKQHFLFFFPNWKMTPRWPPPPLIGKFQLDFFVLFLKPSLISLYFGLLVVFWTPLTLHTQQIQFRS